MTRLSIEMLPAAHGDALWVEWRDGATRRRMLVDGGPGQAYPALRRRIDGLSGKDRSLDLLVITHVDTDHIDGAVTLLLDDLELEIDDVWFNGQHHVHRPESPVAGNHYLGGAEGQVLSAILAAAPCRWNGAFGGRAIVVRRGSTPLPTATVGGLTLTILSPGAEELKKLSPVWDADLGKALRRLELVPEGATPKEVAEAIRKGGLATAHDLLADRYGKRLAPPPGWDPAAEESVFLGDSSRANGSSIAFLLEDEDRESAVLLTGDAHARVLLDSVRRLLLHRGQKRLRLDALKLPHHGSKHNLSTRLLAKLECDAYLFSTDGSHGFGHPHDETIEWILEASRKRGSVPELYFNYLSDRSEPWREASRGNGTKYRAHYPREGRGEYGVKLELG